MRTMRKKFPRIKELRKSFRLSQQDVAKILHINQSLYSRLELGENKLSVAHLITLALVYNVTTDYILGLSNNPIPDNVSHFLKEDEQR